MSEIDIDIERHWNPFARLLTGTWYKYPRLNGPKFAWVCSHDSPVMRFATSVKSYVGSLDRVDIKALEQYYYDRWNFGDSSPVTKQYLDLYASIDGHEAQKDAKEEFLESRPFPFRWTIRGVIIEAGIHWFLFFAALVIAVKDLVKLQSPAGTFIVYLGAIADLYDN